MTLADLANRLGCRLEGDGSLDIARVTSLEDAGPGDLTFFSNPRYHSALRHTRATAVILGEDGPAAPCAMLRTRAPYIAFARALALFHPQRAFAPGIHPSAVVAADARIGDGAHVGPLVVLEAGAVVGARTVLVAQVYVGPGVRIGADCLVHPQVSLREGVTVGDRVVLQDGVVLGGDGYGFAPAPDGSHHKIPQVGAVVIEDDVEIGANTTVDRPSVGETRIGRGTKIDNLVQVAHGVRIGRHVLLAAQVGIAGSSHLEDGVMLGGQVGVSGHITLGRGVRATAQTGIPNSVPAGALVSGYPAIDNREWLKASAVFRRLPELKKAVAELQRRLADLEAGRSREGDAQP